QAFSSTGHGTRITTLNDGGPAASLVLISFIPIRGPTYTTMLPMPSSFAFPSAIHVAWPLNNERTRASREISHGTNGPMNGDCQKRKKKISDRVRGHADSSCNKTLRSTHTFILRTECRSPLEDNSQFSGYLMVC